MNGYITEIETMETGKKKGNQKRQIKRKRVKLECSCRPSTKKQKLLPKGVAAMETRNNSLKRVAKKSTLYPQCEKKNGIFQTPKTTVAKKIKIKRKSNGPQHCFLCYLFYGLV